MSVPECECVGESFTSAYLIAILWLLLLAILQAGHQRRDGGRDGWQQVMETMRLAEYEVL